MKYNMTFDSLVAKKFYNHITMIFTRRFKYGYVIFKIILNSLNVVKNILFSAKIDLAQNGRIKERKAKKVSILVF